MSHLQPVIETISEEDENCVVGSEPSTLPTVPESAPADIKEEFIVPREALSAPGKIGSDRQTALSSLLAKRIDRSAFENKFVDRENARENVYNKLTTLLLKRPTKEKLQQLNVIKEAKASALASRQEALVKQQTKDKLSNLIAARPDRESLEKRRIIVNPELSSEMKTQSKNARDLLSEKLALRPKFEHLIDKKIISESLHGRFGEKKSVSTDGEAVPKQIASLADRHIVRASCGYAHTSVLDNKSQLHVFGSTLNGRLGLGDSDELFIAKPTLVSSLSGVQHVDCGDNHSVAVANEGEVYTWGVGSWGRLGLGHQADVSAPSKVEMSEKALDAVCGAYHTLVLGTSGKVYGFGWHNQGRIGVGSSDETLTIETPLEIEALTSADRIVSIAAGQGGSVAVTAGGKLYTWGSGSFGALGHGDSKDQWAPKQVESVKDLTFVRAAMGANHALALTTDGQVYSWGHNASKQLGRSDAKEDPLPGKVSVPGDVKIVSVACGKSHSVAIAEDGTVFTWGLGSRGVLGHGSESTVAKPTAVAALSGYKVVQASCSWVHTVFVTADGKVLACGSKQDGKLGF